MNRLVFFVIVLWISASALGCNTESHPSLRRLDAMFPQDAEPKAPEEYAVVDPALDDARRTFNAAILTHLIMGNESAAVATLSVYQSLLTILQGADNTTYEEFHQILFNTTVLYDGLDTTNATAIPMNITLTNASIPIPVVITNVTLNSSKPAAPRAEMSEPLPPVELMVVDADRFEAAPPPPLEKDPVPVRLVVDLGLAALQLNDDLLRNMSSSYLFDTSFSVFVADGRPLDASFSGQVNSLFHTQVVPVNFSDPTAAADQINSRVNSTTNGTLAAVVDPSNITASTSLILVNSLLFKGNWLHEFDPQLSFVANFTGANNETREVTMMKQTARFARADILTTFGEVRTVRMRLSGFGNFSMLFLLPSDNSRASMRNLQRLFGPYSNFTFDLGDFIDEEQLIESTVILPRFKTSSTFDLTGALQDMGLHDAFNAATANFSRLFTDTDSGVMGPILHQVSVEIDETGATAAAASAVGMMVTADPGQPDQIVFDRSFMFVVLQDENEAVILTGVYA